MGVMSRRVMPVCGKFCVCFPGLRARSRHPVKRYKKILAEIFPKSQADPPNNHKIGKLCEYATKNPLRIPKIAKALEQRGYKELRIEHFGSVQVVMRAFSKLLSSCKDHMSLFAMSALHMICALLDQTRHDQMRILGCKCLADFIKSQVDGNYLHNLGVVIPKLCILARETGEEYRRRSLRAAGLQALSSLVWLMGRHSHIFADFNDVVAATLDNFEIPSQVKMEGHSQSQQPWVGEMLLAEGRATVALMRDAMSKLTMQPSIKHLGIPSRDEPESPGVWSQICVQHMAQLANEATTLRRVVEPMFEYFDIGRHWSPIIGLALPVLRNVHLLMEDNGRLLLSALIKHLDHKNMLNHPLSKTNIIAIVVVLAKQSKTKAKVAELGVMSDLTKHLRKSLQTSVEALGLGIRKDNVDIHQHHTFQKAIKGCLLELAKDAEEVGPILDMMASAMAKLSRNIIIARTTMETMCLLAQLLKHLPHQSYGNQVFPETLFHELIQAMVHPDPETRVGAHQVFALTLISSSNATLDEGTKQQLDVTSWENDSPTFFSVTSTSRAVAVLFERFCKEQAVSRKLEKAKDGNETGCFKNETQIKTEHNGRSANKGTNEYSAQSFKNNSGLLGSQLHRNDNSICTEKQRTIVRLGGHQASDLLSTIWREASLHDSLPLNFEAIAHTYILTLVFSRAESQEGSTPVRACQLALSIRSLALDDKSDLPPSRRRSLFMLATAMLVFVGRAYDLPQIVPIAKSTLNAKTEDPFLELADDYTLKVVEHANAIKYGQVEDDLAAVTSLSWICLTLETSNDAIVSLLVRNSINLVEVEGPLVGQSLRQSFVPDAFGFRARWYFDAAPPMPLGSNNFVFFEELVKQSHGDVSDFESKESREELPQLIAQTPPPTPSQHVLTVGQLLEATLNLEGEGHVESVPLSTTPMLYTAVTSQCEALRCGNRKKLAVVLKLDTNANTMCLSVPAEDFKVTQRHAQYLSAQFGHGKGQNTTYGKNFKEPGIWMTPSHLPEPLQAFKLPPASPYDNFLRAASMSAHTF